MKALELFDLIEAGTPIVEIVEKLAGEAETEVEYNDQQATIYPLTSRRRKEYNLAAMKALERAETFRFVVSIMRLDRLAIRKSTEAKNA
jgi:hypothetical protein